MQIRQGMEAEWSLAVRDFSQDETGNQFRTFLEAWCDTAERVMAEDNLTPYAALNRALPITEDMLGYMHGDYLGQMLVWIIGVWGYGNEAADGMTPLETKVVSTAAQARREALERQAEEAL